MRRDPRTTIHLSQRDVDAFMFIGEGFEVAQYQLHEAVFRGLSEVVVSRFVRRWAQRGFLAIDRWNNIGVNRLRLTALCRDELVARGVAHEAQLFAPRKPVAVKDVAHTLWINDLRVVLGQSDQQFDLVLPAWALQRRFGRAPRAIPDLLAIRSPQGDDRGVLVAAEVDLGGERLNAIFFPKLLRLQELVREWAADAPAHILIYTRGAQRAMLLRQFADELQQIPMSIALLPEANGREALNRLRQMMRDAVAGVNSCRLVELTPFLAEHASSQAFTEPARPRLLEEEVGSVVVAEHSPE